MSSGQLVGTKYGLSAPLVAQDMLNLTPRKMRMLTPDDFRRVALEQFWNPLHCDTLPTGLDLLVFDHGFNTGLKTSVKLLQHIAGVRDDGVMGPVTLQAISNATAVQLISYLNHDMIVLLQKEMMLDETGTINTDMRAKLNCLKWRTSLWCCALASMQEVDYRRKRSFSTFGKGWLDRVHKRAVAGLELCREARLSSEKTPSRIA